MIAKLSIYLVLIVICNSQTTLFDSLTPRLLSYYVTKDGVINLQKDSYGFYAYVDFQYEYSEASESDSGDTSIGLMSVALYTSQTVLMQSCLNFYEYYCSSYGCYAYTWWSSSFNLPYFGVTGYYAQSQVYLDYGNWVLNNYATIATSCSGYTNSSYGTSRYGIVGLGTNSSANSNFVGGSTVFSVTVAKDLSTATLMFKENTDVTSSASYIASACADSEWHVPESTVTIQVASSTTEFSAGAIFDLDADTIGFPSTAYSSIISTLQDSVSSLSCGYDNYKPTCYYNGKYRDLPDIQLSMFSLQISIPPAIYVEGYDTDESDEYLDGEIVLNFRSLDSSLEDNSYVTSDYEDYIIFGQTFMSYYYTQFTTNSSGNFIDLYSQYTSPSGHSSHVIWPFIVGGVLGFIFVLGLICCCIHRRNKRVRDRARARLFENDSLANGSNLPPQVSSLQETQIPNIPYPPQSYASYNYNQGGYGYPQQFPAQPYQYGNNGAQVGGYNYIPPLQGQFNGDMRGYTVASQQ